MAIQKAKAKTAEQKINRLARKILNLNLKHAEIKKFLDKELKNTPLEKKIILQKIKSLRREKAIMEEVQEKVMVDEVFNSKHPDFKKLSNTHRKFYQKLKKQEEKNEFLANKELYSKRKELYEYFRSIGHAGGVKPGFFKGYDKVTVMKITEQATEDFNAYADYLRRFFSPKAADRLEPDQLPREGIALRDEKFFADARNDYLEKTQGESLLNKENPLDIEKSQTLPTEIKTKKKPSIKSILKNMVGNEKKIAEKLIKKVWHRKDNLNEKEINTLRKLGYRETDNRHQVYNFNSKLVACLAYKPEDFNHGSYKGDNRETLHHFSRPFLLKELIPTTQILVRLKSNDGKERIIDAVLTARISRKEKKAAVEFQESHKEGPDEIINKIEPILKEYDSLIIVCTDEYKKVYTPFQRDNIFVMNNQEFKNLLREWKLID